LDGTTSGEPRGPAGSRSFGFGGLTVFRAALLVIAAVVGLTVLAKAFPSDASRNVAGGPKAAVPVGSPSPSPSPTVSPRVRGVVVQVLNGTTKTGLAASETQKLASAGYKMKAPGDAPTTTRTTIYFRSDSKVDAAYLRDSHYPGARIRAAGSTFPPDVEITVVLGEDVVTGPSTSP
jgi:LytR cell envelope-related transcriptional attenuator